MEQDTIQILSNLLRPIDLLCSRVILRKTSRIEEVNVSFLKSWHVLKVNYFSPGSPLQFYLGVNMPSEAIVLTGNPASFAKMISKDQVEVTTPEMALEFARIFLETTRSNAFTFYLINSLNDIDFLPYPSQEIREKIEKLKKSLADLVKPAVAVPADGKFIVNLYAVMGLDLVFFEVTVLPLGTLIVKRNEIQKNMPVCRTA